MNARSLAGASSIPVLGVLWTTLALSATITIHNINDPGVGFNDSTAASPVGGNTGTTRGDQRLIVFKTAANQWAALLQSNVTITVEAQMTALACNATNATLGSAGASTLWWNFANAPRANVVYAVAEASSYAGFDLDSGGDDIHAQFNVSLDDADPNCLGGETWWYGIDPDVTPTPGTIPLLPVVFHELGHGLGFSAFTDTTTGAYVTAAYTSDPPIWAFYLFDTGTGKLWKDMTNGERLTSLTNDPHLVWTGTRTNKQAGGYLRDGNALIINTPMALSGPNEVGTAAFGPVVSASGVTGDLAYVDDSVPGGTIHDGCEAFTGVSGKIAVMDRGYCDFTVKVKNAQNAGAIAALIVNNEVDALRLPLTLGGSDGTITIPSYSVTQALGTEIKADLPSPGVNATLGYANLGVDEGCVRMFAPDLVLPGSSISHFHADASPDLLMEPALNETIFNRVDLTLPLFADIGWNTNKADDFTFFDGFDPNPCQHVQP